MAHKEQKDFFEKVKQKYPEHFKNKKVLEVGSLDVNGTHNDLFEDCSYIGLDVGEGPNVDVVSIGHLYDAPDNYFDTIISGSVFEHDMYYEKTFANIIRMLKPGGLFLFTCAGPGYPEHGTRRTGSEFDAPLLSSISDEWADYYKNLSPEDVKDIPVFMEYFPDGYFEVKSTEIEIPSDLYFYGFKGGNKYINTNTPKYPKDKFQDHIFVIDSWPDNEPKENDLVNLIKHLKTYNIQILLTGHYPIKPEIQKMVDYYLYDKNNPVLFNEDFDDYGVNSGRWTNIDGMKVTNKYPFHHDYAIWETMRNSFNFCKYLDKKYIHFMEYDNLPNINQYKQAFLERIKDFDAIMYEYDDGSTKESPPYSSAYIFSIKTDIGIKAIDTIKSKEEYFVNKPFGWQLEKTLLNAITSVSNNVFISDYIANDNELNTQAVWSRDDVNRNGARFQGYLGVDNQDNLYVHLISGFYKKKAQEDYLIEISYGDHKKFHTLKIGEYLTEKIGKYKKGMWVKMYNEGVEVYKEFLGEEVEEFRKYNSIDFFDDSNDKQEITNNELKNRQININFVNGPYIEILEHKPHKYKVQIIDGGVNKIIHEQIIYSNHYVTAYRKYHTNWVIKVFGVGFDFYYEHKMDLKDKRVLIGFDSKSLGDTLAWIPYVDKFAKENECEVICSTFINNLFEGQYPNIEFVKPGTSVADVYAGYSFGYFYDSDKPDMIDEHRNPTDPRKGPLAKVASDILGLEFEEIRPKIKSFDVKKKKQVVIATHSTAQCKYWNNPSGWQNVVNYLKRMDYKVILLSREPDGYMGNKNPKGVVKHKDGPLSNVIKTIQESEMFIGISTGLSWLSWTVGTPTILISGFTDEMCEPQDGIYRVINKDVCNGCWGRHKFNPGEWDWCPEHNGTNRKFECSKGITSKMVFTEIQKVLNEKN